MRRADCVCAAGFFVTVSTRGGQRDGLVSVAVEDREMAVIDELMRYVSAHLHLHNHEYIVLAAMHALENRESKMTQAHFICKQSLPRLAGWDQAFLS